MGGVWKFAELCTVAKYEKKIIRMFILLRISIKNVWTGLITKDQKDGVINSHILLTQ